MNKRGQVAFEYLTMIGVSLIILFGLVAFAYSWTASSRDSVSVSIARNTVENIVESVDLVGAQGYPAKTTISVQIPDGIVSAEINGSVVSMRVKVNGGFTDVSATAKENMTGKLPTARGCYKYSIQSFDSYVNISRYD